MERWQEQTLAATIPMKRLGPVTICMEAISESVMLPLASFETTLFPSVQRGAKTVSAAGGIRTVCLSDQMTRSILLEADNAAILFQVQNQILQRQAELQTVVSSVSRFAKLLQIQPMLVGCNLFLRLCFSTGDAAGHNMTTLSAQAIMDWMLAQFPALRYVSISGNVCTDKKVSAVNGLLGRGKYVIAETLIPKKICERFLKTTPEKIVQLHQKKNLLGSIVSGGLRSANAHFANMLLACYLATGQDAANIVEGSQGMVDAECRGDDLYFSVTVPNLIVGTVGHGKNHAFVQDNLKLLGCLEARAAGENAKRLAQIISAAVLCGELSLLAAQTNRGELMASHLTWERQV